MVNGHNIVFFAYLFLIGLALPTLACVRWFMRSRMKAYATYVVAYSILAAVMGVLYDYFTRGAPRIPEHVPMWLVPLFFSGLRISMPVGILTGLVLLILPPRGDGSSRRASVDGQSVAERF